MKKFIYRYEAMSTPCEITLYAHTKHQADNTANAVLSETKRLEHKYNYYNKNSLISQINSRKIQTLDIETKSIFQRTKKYYKLTNGLFDITIATVKDLYRYEKNIEQFTQKIAILKPFIGTEHFKIQRNKIRFDNPYTKIDVGGFVKEYAVDRSITIIQNYKINSAIVNYGGDIYALGKKPDNSKFSIGVKEPLQTDKIALYVQLENEALTTSASYERNYTIESQRYSHIISNRKLQKDVNSVSVISKNCVESGVYSTSLMIDKNLFCKNKVIIL